MTDETKTASEKLLEELQKTQPAPARITGPVAAQVKTVQAGINTAVKPGSNGLLGGAAAPVMKPPVSTSVRPPQTTNVSQLVRAATASVGPIIPPRPKGIISGNTREIENGYFRFVLFSETNCYKTTTAAHFDSPEWVRIIGTRHPEQMASIKSEGYVYSIAQDAAQLEWLLRYPDAEWKDWWTKPDPERRRTLLLDDGTEAVNMLLDDNASNDGRKTYGEAGKALRRTLLKHTLWRPLNFGMTALAKAKDSPVRPDEEIYGPNLPPAMLDLVMAEFEFVFYIDKGKKKLRTEDTSFVYTWEGPGGPKDVRTTKRIIYAKSKIDFHDLGKGVLKPEEDLNLGELWKRVRMSQQSAGAKAGRP